MQEDHPTRTSQSKMPEEQSQQSVIEIDANNQRRVEQEQSRANNA